MGDTHQQLAGGKKVWIELWFGASGLKSDFGMA